MPPGPRCSSTQSISCVVTGQSVSLPSAFATAAAAAAAVIEFEPPVANETLLQRPGFLLGNPA